MHIEENHKNPFRCSMCPFKSIKMIDLEQHIVSVHEHSKRYNCSQCANKFVTEWRLKKHMKMHDTQKNKVRFCHCANNGKQCKFSEIGCKFIHEDMINIHQLYLRNTNFSERLFWCLGLLINKNVALM